MDDHHSVVRFLRRRARDGLRGAAVYEGASIEDVWIRDDLRESEARDRIERLVDSLPDGWDGVDETLAGEYDDRLATLDVREQGVLVHVPRDPDSGLVVALEPEVASQLGEFLAECAERVRESEPPTA